MSSILPCSSILPGPPCPPPVMLSVGGGGLATGVWPQGGSGHRGGLAMGGFHRGEGVRGEGGRGHFGPAAIYCTATWCFALKGFRTTTRLSSPTRKQIYEVALCVDLCRGVSLVAQSAFRMRVCKLWNHCCDSEPTAHQSLAQCHRQHQCD